MSNVLLPRSRARLYPRFTTVVVLPSPFKALVTAMMVEPRPSVDNTNFETAMRYCSAAIDRGCHFATRLRCGGSDSSRVAEGIQVGYAQPPRPTDRREPLLPLTRERLAGKFPFGG